MPVPSAAPWPRLTGWLTTCAPARHAWSAVSSDEPSSTTTMFGSQLRTLSSVRAITDPSLKPGMTSQTPGWRADALRERWRASSIEGAAASAARSCSATDARSSGDEHCPDPKFLPQLVIRPDEYGLGRIY